MAVSRRILVIALFLLSLLFAVWFRNDRHLLASLLVFAAPPLLLAAGVLLRVGHAAFWAGVVALLWFCHGVVVAWSRPAEAGWAGAEIALSLAVVVALSWPGLQARFGRGKRTG